MAIGALPQTCDGTGPPVAWIRSGQAGYVGPDLGVDLHAASVGVLTVGLDAPLTVETAGHGTLVTRSFYAPARTAHRAIAAEGRILLLFTDSAVATTQALGPFGLGHAREPALIAACRQDPEPDLLRALAGRAGLPPAGDPRIRRVVDQIRDDPAPVFRADQTAGRAGLSTPHFLRLFAQHTGTTFRRYQQWNRLLAAARGIAAGHPLTRCAADAGFASPSHLSDTFHETLGTTASAVLGSRVRFVVEG